MTNKRKRGKPTAFGVKVNTELYKRGMTKRELAQVVGMNETYLHDILYGRRSGTRYIEPIKKVLGL
ncbi:MAG: XRE family transcriptional regulator [Peptostreptococcaceae bacterium]|nr:XRE family transcriptional regulator [Peptostreptococcaceae bacterium]